MPTQKCVDNVNSAPPPGNVWCGDTVCAQIQQTVDKHCNVNGYKPDDPWLLQDSPGHWCSCCCSCYGQDTPIEAQPGVFVKVQDIKTGDIILAAGLGLVWQPTQVSFASGMQTGHPDYPVLNVVFRFADGDVRLLQVTDDTLFLMTSGLLKSAELLAPGDRLRRADGGEAEILGPVTKALAVGVHSVEMGPFDGTNLDGHLLSTYGVVTADLSVQRVHSRGGLRDVRFVEDAVLDPGTLVAGTEEYLIEYAPTQSFLDEVAAAGVRIDPSALAPPKPLITIPPQAKGFLHPGQANDIRANAPLFPSTNTFRITVAQKVFDLAQSGHDDVAMLIDWNNSQPNAYAWSQMRQKFVVVTGGLLRVQPLTEAGLALVLAHLLAYHAGAQCVGEADHAAINDDLRQIWPLTLFPMMCERAVDEMKTLFGYVDRRSAQDDPDDRCGRPSLDCRLQAYAAAMGMQPVPECAGFEKP
jgi:hypothetical protein